MQEHDLEKCRHCGGEAEYRYGSSTSPYVRCKKCGCRTGSSRDLAKLARIWNSNYERTCRIEEFDLDGNPVGETVFGDGFCSSCWGIIDFEDKFCRWCGASMEER